MQIQMKCRIMRHFIWVFTVCQSICLGVSDRQRVNPFTFFVSRLLFCHLLMYFGGLTYKYGVQFIVSLFIDQFWNGSFKHPKHMFKLMNIEDIQFFLNEYAIYSSSEAKNAYFLSCKWIFFFIIYNFKHDLFFLHYIIWCHTRYSKSRQFYYQKFPWDLIINGESRGHPIAPVKRSDIF